MADYNLEQIVQALYICGLVNTPNLTASNYHQFLANVQAPVIPGLEYVTDQEMVGDGSAATIRNLRNTYWGNGAFNVKGALNDHIAAILLHGWLGGTITPTPRTAPSKDLACVMNIINSNPRLFSIYRHLGGERFLHTSMAVDTFEIAQEGEADPTMDFNLRSTGHFLDDAELTAASFDESAFQPAPEYAYFKGAMTGITATDGTNSYNWTQDGELISLSITGNNKVDVQRRPGDGVRVSTDRQSGSFARKIRNGRGIENMIKLKVDLRSDLREFKAMVANKKLTGLAINFNGYDKVGATSDWHEFQINAPVAKFATVEGETDQDFGALSLNILPLRDTVTRGYLTDRVRTEKTLF